MTGRRLEGGRIGPFVGGAKARVCVWSGRQSPSQICQGSDEMVGKGKIDIQRRPLEN